MAFKNEHDAGYLSEPIFGRFGSHVGVENGQTRSSIGIKDEHEAKAKIFQKHHEFTVKMASRRDRTSIKNRSKSHLKAVLS